MTFLLCSLEQLF